MLCTFAALLDNKMDNHYGLRDHDNVDHVSHVPLELHTMGTHTETEINSKRLIKHPCVHCLSLPSHERLVKTCRTIHTCEQCAVSLHFQCFNHYHAKLISER